jgi:hypothetical protein
MISSPRKKSPRAPSIPLDEALDHAIKAYEKERLHPAPTEVVAQNLGYKSANNGTALSAIASLRYFGLLERPKEGQLSVAKNVESYKFSPDEGLRRSLLTAFLMAPPLYADLLQKYRSGLPSDANLRFELIQRGFIPQAAEAALSVFKRSVEFVGYFNDQVPEAQQYVQDEPAKELDEKSIATPAIKQEERNQNQMALPAEASDDLVDRIPVRLPGGRRAWLAIPSPFFESDKARLKAQIDLLLTEDQEQD